MRENMDAYKATAEPYAARVTQSVTDSLTEALDAALTKVLNKNRQKLLEIVSAGRQKSVKAYNAIFEAAKFPGEGCSAESETSRLADQAIKAGMEMFMAETKLSAGEPFFQQQRKDATNTLKLQRDPWNKKNNACIRSFCEERKKEESQRMKVGTHSIVATFPEYETALIHKKIDALKAAAVRQYSQSSAKRFAHTPQFKSARKALVKEGDDWRKTLLDTNDRQIKLEVQPALDEVREDFLDDICPCSLTQPFCSCTSWFKTKVVKKTTRALERTMKNVKARRHIPKIIDLFIVSDLKAQTTTMESQDKLHNYIILGTLVILAVGAAWYKLKEKENARLRRRQEYSWIR
jgi:hypothetical protein